MGTVVTRRTELIGAFDTKPIEYDVTTELISFHSVSNEC